jgi:hypothetical protein
MLVSFGGMYSILIIGSHYTGFYQINSRSIPVCISAILFGYLIAFLMEKIRVRRFDFSL